MTYESKFPNFDDASSCDRLLSLGFTDTSYENDTSPSFERNGVAIYVDYNDAALSEWQGRDEFRISVIDLETDEQVTFDNLDHALMYHALLAHPPSPKLDPRNKPKKDQTNDGI